VEEIADWVSRCCSTSPPVSMKRRCSKSRRLRAGGTVTKWRESVLAAQCEAAAQEPISLLSGSAKHRKKTNSCARWTGKTWLRSRLTVWPAVAVLGT